MGRQNKGSLNSAAFRYSHAWTYLQLVHKAWQLVHSQSDWLKRSFVVYEWKVGNSAPLHWMKYVVMGSVFSRASRKPIPEVSIKRSIVAFLQLVQHVPSELRLALVIELQVFELTNLANRLRFSDVIRHQLVHRVVLEDGRDDPGVDVAARLPVDLQRGVAGSKRLVGSRRDARQRRYRFDVTTLIRKNKLKYQVSFGLCLSAP